MEQPNVEIPRGVLAALVLGLVGSLMAVAFLLGRQSVQPTAAATPQSAPAPVVAVAPPVEAGSETPHPRPISVPVSRPRLKVQVAAPPRVAPEAPAARVEGPTAPAPPSQPRPRPAPARTPSKTAAAAGLPKAGGSAPKAPSHDEPHLSAAEKDSIRRYFAQVDAVMADTGALEDPNAFATELLQQSMQGDNSGFESLLNTAKAALGKMQAIKAPAACKEHHQLMVSQLKEGVTLLRSVQSAATTGDTSVLASLALQGKDMRLDIGRLQELDRELRASAAKGR